jgi:hypothetical protein
MQITVDIPDEFAARAAARGLTPETYLRTLIDEAAQAADKLPARLSMAEFIRRFSADSEKIPQLPDEAFTRQSLYRDHD